MKELATANSIAAPGGFKEILDNEKFQDIVLKEVQSAGRKGGLAGIELVSGIVLVHEEWTPQNVSCDSLSRKSVYKKSTDLVVQGLLTSAMKLNRRKIVETYKKDIEKAYSKHP